MKEKPNMGTIDRKIHEALRRSGYLTHKEVSSHLNITPDEVTELKNNNQILGTKFEGFTYYPTPQFNLSNLALPIFVQALNELKDVTHMKKLFFFSDAQLTLDNKSPFDWLMKNNQTIMSSIPQLAKEFAQNNRQKGL